MLLFEEPPHATIPDDQDKKKTTETLISKEIPCFFTASWDGMSDPNMETKRFHWWIVKSLALSHVAPVHEDLRGK